ncbi:hypothetical protein [Streptomyces sp. NRRL S-1896]|uniref:hypothetical protein n=1 Tax=Streptomyces sp. NRRL S-1896 TaxID=1463893 RepID=UPI0004CB9A89|nr:hypothetical protein [Streptomyces sp. NRRL S-1896]
MLELLATLLLVASTILLLTSPGIPSPRRYTAAALLLLPSALLYALAHHDVPAGLVLLLATLHAGIAAGLFWASRQHPDTKPTHNDAPRP